MLPKNCRLSLREPGIFKKAFKVTETPFFRVYLLKTDESKGAIIISKKQVLKSSDRNLLKRRVNSILFSLLPKFKNISVIVWVKNKSLSVYQEQLARDLESVFIKYT